MANQLPSWWRKDSRWVDCRLYLGGMPISNSSAVSLALAFRTVVGVGFEIRQAHRRCIAVRMDDPNSRYVSCFRRLAYKAGIGPKVTANPHLLGSADSATTLPPDQAA